MATDDPIFIHSLFRAAGGYVLEKFRSLGPAYTCYQDPFGETIADSDGRRAPHELFREDFAYRQYFVADAAPLPAGQLAYLTALIGQAPGRPVLQFQRSSGRAHAMRRHFRGIHIHLWREPRGQWWSYRIADYFDRAVRRIYRCAQLPQALRQIAAMLDLGAQTQSHLNPCDNYRLFYALWLDAWLRLCACASLSISLDHLSTSRFQNLRCSARLSELSGCVIDLSDVRPSGMVLSLEEAAFYAEVESAVNDIFVASGRATAESIRAADAAARSAREAHRGGQHDLSIERNLRQATLTMMQAMAGQRHSRLQGQAKVLAARLRNRWRALVEPLASTTP